MKEVSEKASVILMILIVLLITSSFIFSFSKYLLSKDYWIEIKYPCNPENASCFVMECEENDPRCVSETPGVYFYKVIIKKAYSGSPVDQCEKTKTCEVIYCSPDNASVYSYSENCN